MPKDTTAKMHGRLYQATSNRPVTKVIHTQNNAIGRALRLDLILAGSKLQPYIHDAVVEVSYRKTLTKFHIFAKNHKRLPPNKIVNKWNNGNTWRRDILIMRKGVLHEFVSMRSGDASLADLAVKR